MNLIRQGRQSIEKTCDKSGIRITGFFMIKSYNKQQTGRKNQQYMSWKLGSYQDYVKILRQEDETKKKKRNKTSRKVGKRL